MSSINRLFDAFIFLFGAAGVFINIVLKLMGIDEADTLPWIAVMVSGRALARVDAVWERFMLPRHMRKE